MRSGQDRRGGVRGGRRATDRLHLARLITATADRTVALLAFTPYVTLAVDADIRRERATILADYTSYLVSLLPEAK